MILLLILNAVAAFVSTASAVLVLVRPEAMSGSNPHSVSAGERFFARMYAARAIPFGLITAVMPFMLFAVTCDLMAVRLVLATAAVIQAIDVVIGLSRKEWGMVAGPSVAALIHTLTACFLH